MYQLSAIGAYLNLLLQISSELNLIDEHYIEIL